MRLAVGVVCALILAGTPATARAQDRLFIGSWDSGVEVGAMGHLGQVLGSSQGLHLPLAGGGRYAVFGSSIVDLRTGAIRSLPAGAWVVAVDVARPRVFVAAPSPGSPADIDVLAFEVTSGGSRRLFTMPACGFGAAEPLVRHAAANVLFVRTCPPAGVRSEVVAIDLRVEPPATRVAATVPRLAAIEVSSDGTRVFAAVGGWGYDPSTIEAYDTATGALVAAASAPAFRTMAWDETRAWLMVEGATSLFDATLSVFDPNLGRLGAVPFPGTGPCGVRWQVSPHTGRIYVMTGGSDYYGAPPVSLTVFDGQPLASQGPVPITPSLTTCAGALRTAPGAPRRLRADVAGHDVTLHFENVGGASHFVLEAGFAPGRTDLSLYLGPDTPVTFLGVPSGTYYLRLRGGNEFGGSLPSEELMVVVP